jgi:hypothetical protein
MLDSMEDVRTCKATEYGKVSDVFARVQSGTVARRQGRRAEMICSEDVASTLEGQAHAFTAISRSRSKGCCLLSSRVQCTEMESPEIMQSK